MEVKTNWRFHLVLVRVLLLGRDTLTTLIKEAIYLELAYSFRALVHCHHVNMVLHRQTWCWKWVRALHPDPQAIGRESEPLDPNPPPVRHFLSQSHT